MNPSNDDYRVGKIGEDPGEESTAARTLRKNILRVRKVVVFPKEN